MHFRHLVDHTVLHSDRHHAGLETSGMDPSEALVILQVPLKWTGAESLALLQENRQKWREFCYGFENLKEWGATGFPWFSCGFPMAFPWFSHGFQ